MAGRRTTRQTTAERKVSALSRCENRQVQAGVHFRRFLPLATHPLSSQYLPIETAGQQETISGKHGLRHLLRDLPAPLRIDQEALEVADNVLDQLRCGGRCQKDVVGLVW